MQILSQLPQQMLKMNNFQQQFSQYNNQCTQESNLSQIQQIYQTLHYQKQLQLIQNNNTSQQYQDQQQQQIQYLLQQLQNCNNMTFLIQKQLKQCLNNNIQQKAEQQLLNLNNIFNDSKVNFQLQQQQQQQQITSSSKQSTVTIKQEHNTFTPFTTADQLSHPEKINLNKIEIVTKVENVETSQCQHHQQQQTKCQYQKICALSQLQYSQNSQQEMAKKQLQKQLNQQSLNEKEDLQRLEHLYQQIAKKVEKNNLQKRNIRMEHKKKKKMQSLAQRNTKINFASGLYNFLQFKTYLARRRKQWQDHEILFKLADFMRTNIKIFQSFDGWKYLLSDEIHGKQLQKYARLFFKKKFAFDYITNSRINKNYLEEHLKLINKFKVASGNPQLFTPNYFKQLKE